MWFYIPFVIFLMAIVLYPLQGWMSYLVKQWRRERQFKVTESPRHPEPARWRDSEVTVAWLGHATVLINFYGKWILTDPVFGASVGIHGPLGLSFGPRRLVRCAMRPDELPKLDLIVQSHAHM